MIKVFKSAFDDGVKYHTVTKISISEITKFEKYLEVDTGKYYFEIKYFPEHSYVQTSCIFSETRQFNYIEINRERFNYRKMLAQFERVKALIEQEKIVKAIDAL